jgi:hypothetical protein
MTGIVTLDLTRTNVIPSPGEIAEDLVRVLHKIELLPRGYQNMFWSAYPKLRKLFEIKLWHILPMGFREFVIICYAPTMLLMR